MNTSNITLINQHILSLGNKIKSIRKYENLINNESQQDFKTNLQEIETCVDNLDSFLHDMIKKGIF